ncbi:MAG: lamin tail domain-containing protein, partial [Salibacteraceae bacterium]
QSLESAADSVVVYDGLDSSVVLFYLKDKLPIGGYTYHNFRVASVKDLVGNIMNPFITAFHFPTRKTGQKGDLLINEIFADPTPQIGLPSAEFIEIIVTNSYSYDLKDWTFSDPSKTATLPSYILNNGEHLILCAISDTALFSPFGSVLGLVDFPSLNNSSDVITLRDSAGTLIDEVAYSDSWYGSSNKADGGFSLELINPNHPCGGASNWIGSESVDGGTPGAQNSVYNTAPDTINPNLMSVSIMNTNELKVVFSKALDSTSLAQGTYSITNGISSSAVVVPSAYSNEITLVLSSAPSKGVLYSLTVSGVADCFGNTLGINSVDFGLGETPNPLEVIINELLPDPDDTKTTVSEYEYVELHNVSNKIISLDSCSFSDLSSSASLTGGVILPDEFLILCESKAVSALSQYGPVLGLSNWPSLNNSSDQISITTSNEIIHQVNYETAWYGDDTKSGGGWSLELIDPNNPCEGEFNWKASIDASGGTPGKLNSVKTLNPSESGPNLLRAEVVNDSVIELFFDQVVLYSDWGVVKFEFSNGLSENRILEIRSQSVLIELSSTLIERIIYKVEISGLVNCSGLSIEKNDASFGLAEKGDLNDLVINEIMFDPYSTATTDYVEVYNRSEKIIDLKNWVICEFDENKDTLDGFKVISTTNRSLIPGGFALISKSNADIIKHYPTNNSSSFIQISAMPSYPNDEGTVVLLNDSGLIIDQVNYSDDWHHISIKNVDGIALERLDYERETQDEGNWHSAAKSVDYGTPGLPNSQFFPATDFSDQVTLEPETFSPDNDGFDDVLNINYEFDEPGYVASVVVYDAEGREIKQLINNELLSIQGTFTWDGSTNDGTVASTGIYILFFEVFNENGKTSKFKKACVLAAKL